MDNTIVYVTNNWFVDHTSVVVNDLRFGCSGDVGSGGDREILRANIDQQYARIIGAFDPKGTRKDYDRAFYSLKRNFAFPLYGDCCGLIYGVQGVCHTMANRILFAGSNKTVNFELKSASGKLSWLLYGYYGRAAILPYLNIPTCWTMYLAICRQANSMLLSNDANVEDYVYRLKAEESATLNNGFVTDLKNSLLTANTSVDSFYKRAMLHELDHLDSADLAINRLDMLLTDKSNASSFDKTEISEAFLKVESAMKNSERLFNEQFSQIGIESNIGYSISYVNEQVRKFNDFCFNTLGKTEYEKLFGAEYRAGLMIVDTQKPIEKGIFEGRFSYRQVFDCKRSPAYPIANSDFKVYDFRRPYGLTTNISKIDLADKVFYFEGQKGENDSIKKISLWMADDENKTNPICLVANGSIYGLSRYGFLYDSDIRFSSIDGYGYVVSLTKAFDYGNNQLIWTTSESKVTSYKKLEDFKFEHPRPIK